MKMDAVPMQAYRPLDLYPRQGAINNQQSTPTNQMCRFEAEMASGNFTVDETETPAATGQPEEFFCSCCQAHLSGFSDIQQNSFAAMNYVDPAAVDENFGEFANSIRTEIGTIPDNEILNTIESDIRAFEASVKEALDNFANDLLSLVQDQTNLFSMAFEGLINAISGQFNSDDSLPAVEVAEDGTKSVAEVLDKDGNPVTAIPDNGEVDDSVATGPEPFNYDKFEMNLREKFIAALDELLKRFREAASVQADFFANENGTAIGRIAENYDQMMANTDLNNQVSENKTITTSA
jgi:hypothetical protein